MIPRGPRGPLGRRVLAAMFCLLLVLPTGAAVARTAEPGASGIGDPYFPLDGNGGIDVLHYGIHDRYDFATGRLSGWTRVRLKATAELSSFNLDLLLPVQAVRIDGRLAGFEKPNRHELRIRPARPLVTGRTYDVRVRYDGRPGVIGWRGERNWLASRTEVVTMNEPHMAAWWFPANDHPRDKARVDIHVTVPRGNQVVANGRQVARRVHGQRVTSHWRAAEPMAPYLAFFAAGRFATSSGVDSRGRPWLVAASRDLPAIEQRRATRALRRTPGITQWLEGQLGTYPFSVTGGLATSLASGFALENQTRPTYSGAPDTLLIVHEMAHQWFGNSVSVHGWRDIWLNEGLATFMEWRWEETHGGPTAQQQLRSLYDDMRPATEFWALRIGSPGPRHLFDWPVYVRGAMTAQALRNRIGEADFWALMRTWAAERRNRNGSTADFHALAERMSGEELDAFFQTWLFGAVAPAPTAENGLA